MRVKKNRFINDEDELREAAGVIFDRFQQSVLVERFIDGREINVGILGNSPPIAHGSHGGTGKNTAATSAALNNHIPVRNTGATPRGKMCQIIRMRA